MTLKDPKDLYTQFLKNHQGKLHFAAHSHHFWPDVTRKAQLDYWDDCSKLSDEKWNKVFGEVIPEAQKHIAEILNLKDPKQIAFAPNTHELLSRILSLFLGNKEVTILTSIHEFHSWRRQLLRLTELPEVKVKLIENDPTERRSFIQAFKDELKKSPDLFFISQVFFNSGYALTDAELMELYQAKTEKTLMVVDGYHGFCALPTDLSQLEGKIFYLAGGYKYAQAGEGAAFLVIPKGDWRPAYTGWFAEFAELSMPKGAQVGYSQDFMAFMGATQDPSGLYRFNAVWREFKKHGLDIKSIHQFIKQQQQYFIDHLPKEFLLKWKLKPLYQDLNWHGHFLTYESSLAEACEKELKNHQIIIDRRGERIRFGFGLYQNKEDLNLLLECLQKLANISP
ncbi:MAG: aminotransferase class V-fold PLP-dependent enzyme [Bacteriovoracaceae bacterium]